MRTAAAAGAAVLAWLGLVLGRYLGDPPDLDAMVATREALVVKRDGFGALIEGAEAGVHPPVLDFLSGAAFAVFGEDPRSQRLIAVLLFLVLAVSIERLLAPHLSALPRVAAAITVAICPSLAIAMFLVSREGLMLGVLAPALVLAFRQRWLWLGAVLALLPLIKETGLLLGAPFALYALLSTRRWRDAFAVGLPVVASAAVWRGVLELAGSKPWESWLLTPNADDGSVVVALRAMFGMEDGIFLRQNLANGLIMNWLWVPALLAVVTLVLVARRPGPLRRGALLLLGLAFVYGWTALSFPTYTIARYAAPLSFFVIVLAVLGLPLYRPRLRPVPIVLLAGVFIAGAWSSNDPVSKGLWDTAEVGGEEIYDAPLEHRGPDRMAFNFEVLRATERVNATLNELYESDVTLATGDCYTMKIGEKLYSVGLHPTAYDRTFPEARAIACVPFDQVPPGTKVALLRSPEELAAGTPPALSGPDVIPLPR